MQALGVVVALAHEARIVRRAAADSGLAGRVRVELCGMGPARAAGAARALAGDGVALLLTVGYAGALAEDLAPGDLVLATGALRAGDAQTLPVDAAAARRGLAALPAGLGTRRGVLVSVDAPVGGRGPRRALARDSGAVAVDMESAAVAAEAIRHGVAWLALRAISDAGEQQVPAGLQAALDPHGRVRPAAFARAVLRRPTDLVAMASLAGGAGRAARSLRRALPPLLSALVGEGAGR